MDRKEHKRLFKSVIIITATMLLISGCGKETEPVISESVEETTVQEEKEESKPEESLPEAEESKPEENPDNTVPIENDSEIEATATNEENEHEQDLKEDSVDYEIIPTEDITYYAVKPANVRNGPSTQYDKVASLSTAQAITCNGRVEDGDSLWLVLKTEDGSTQMVSASLVSTTKPSTSSSSNSTPSTTQQPSQPTVQQPSGGEDEEYDAAAWEAWENETGIPSSDRGLGSAGPGHDLYWE